MSVYSKTIMELPNDVWRICFNHHFDAVDCQALSVVNSRLNLFFKNYLRSMLPLIPSGNQIIDTGSGELSILCKLEIVKLVAKTDSKIMSKFKCLIMREGVNFAGLKKAAKHRGVNFIIPNKEGISLVLGTQSVKKTYPIFISDKALEESSELINEEERKTFLIETRCELPTFLELFSFCIQKQDNSEKFGPYALSSTSIGNPNTRIIIQLDQCYDENSRSHPIIQVFTTSIIDNKYNLCIQGKLK